MFTLLFRVALETGTAGSTPPELTPARLVSSVCWPATQPEARAWPAQTQASTAWTED